MRIAVASDHAGFCQKADLVDYIVSLGHSVEDFGPETDDRVDYPDFAVKVARAVSEGEADYGVLICGTGIGMAMAADKVPGVRAQSIQTPQFAQLMREHNDGNVLCLSGRFVDEKVNEEIIKTFLETPFGGGRHAQRVAKIMALDSECAE
jgi:ribose 5-phosphate isomerase B